MLPDTMGFKNTNKRNRWYAGMAGEIWKMIFGKHNRIIVFLCSGCFYLPAKQKQDASVQEKEIKGETIIAFCYF